jgi:hypothetical protein
MSSDVNAPNGASLQIENRAKIGLEPYGINGFAVSRRELMDFVDAKTWIKRILLENAECLFAACFCLGLRPASARRNNSELIRK